MGVRAFAVLAALVVSVGAVAQRPAAQAEEALQPVLVELFTSEGCSSCPPADELLGKLAGRRTDGGKLIVVLSEHVTYWNRLGWSDPFSADAFTQRQSAYGERFHLESVYTPQAVVNGDREMLGSDAGAIVRAIEAQKAESDAHVRVLKAIATPDGIEVTFVSDRALPQGAGDLFAAVADDMDTSHIGRGENAGRTLTHVAVARSLMSLGQLKAGQTTVKLAVPSARKAPGGGAQHVVMFLQAKGQGAISNVAMAAVMGAFPQQAESAEVH